MSADREGSNYKDERAPELKSDLEAQLDELGTDPGQVGETSAGQSGDTQTLSPIEDASDESVEELAETEFRHADLEDLLFGDKSSDALWYASLAFSLCRI